MKKVQKKKKQAQKPVPQPAGDRRASGMRSYMANRVMQNGGY